MLYLIIFTIFTIFTIYLTIFTIYLTIFTTYFRWKNVEQRPRHFPSRWVTQYISRSTDVPDSVLVTSKNCIALTTIIAELKINIPKSFMLWALWPDIGWFDSCQHFNHWKLAKGQTGRTCVGAWSCWKTKSQPNLTNSLFWNFLIQTFSIDRYHSHFPILVMLSHRYPILIY